MKYKIILGFVVCLVLLVGLGFYIKDINKNNKGFTKVMAKVELYAKKSNLLTIVDDNKSSKVYTLTEPEGQYLSVYVSTEDDPFISITYLEESLTYLKDILSEMGISISENELKKISSKGLHITKSFSLESSVHKEGDLDIYNIIIKNISSS